jgi:hypothetical protein
LSPTNTDRIQRAIGKKDKTYAGEFATLAQVLKILENPRQFKFVDIGAGDGFNMSIAWPLMKHFDSWGLLIEPNLIQLESAKRLYKSNQKFAFSSAFLTPENVYDVISNYGFEESLYVKIDIDSYDLEIMRSMIRQGLKPKVVSIEINELFPPPIRFEVLYSETLDLFHAPFYGCSLQSVFDFASSNGYSLHSLAFNNAFFVLEECVDKRSNFYPLSPTTAYYDGFLNQDWRSMFPWNIEFEDWLKAPASEILQIARRHPEFDSTKYFLSE